MSCPNLSKTGRFLSKLPRTAPGAGHSARKIFGSDGFGGRSLARGKAAGVAPSLDQAVRKMGHIVIRYSSVTYCDIT